ncbi:MAG: hypothetical protein KDK07_14530 [Bauldia sp.]|nr:hypothetical protein [Bauldia sp.]
MRRTKLTSRRAFLTALFAILLGLVALPQMAAAQVQVPNPVPRPAKAPNPNAALPVPKAATAATGPVDVLAGGYPRGRVIVLRGLGNVFSRGMDTLAKELKDRGVSVLLQNHSRWQKISAQLIQDYKADPNTVAPIILIGHSLGGDASIVMSNWLAQNGVPVRFVVIFDAVAQTHPIIGGVQEVLNFYKPKGYGQEVKAASSFRGTIRNVDLTDRKDIDHLNIDEDKVLQGEVIADVMKILNEANKPARKAPVAKAPPPAAEPKSEPGPATAAAGTAPAAPAPVPEPATPVAVEATVPAE